MTKVIALSLLMTLTVFPQELPKQAGFTWWKMPALKGALLVPDGWHKKKSAKDQTLAYFVTKTKITEQQKEFKIGLSLNVFKDFRKKQGKDPLVWAKQYRTVVLEEAKLINSWDKDMGPFKSIGFLTEFVGEGQTLMMHQLFIVNPKTGTLYFYIFEAPMADWEEAWKLGDKMFKLLMIDDEV